MNSAPTISIILPTYNRANLISETIRSVLNQTYANWELIVIDDGSTDETRSLVMSFKDQRIQHHFIEHTASIAMVRNEGLRKAKSEFIAFLDSDDLWKPHKLERQLSLLQSYPDTAFAFANGDQFGEGATPTPVLEDFFAGQIFLPFLLESRFIFYVPSLLFRKEVLHKIPLLDENLQSTADILFFLRLASEFKGIFTNESLVQIRKHTTNHSNEMEPIAADEYIKMLKKLSNEERLSKLHHSLLAAKAYYRLGIELLRHGKAKEAKRNFIQSLKLVPSHWQSWIRMLQTFL